MEHLNVTTDILDVEEARRRLPEVRRHVRAVMEAHEEMERIRSRIAEAGDAIAEEESRSLRRRYREHRTRFTAALKAMNDLGAYLKDPGAGLIDFYTWRGSELAFLCWHHGEEDISYWHGLDDGFSGRKPLD
jgi:hypothetical protein